MPQGFKYDEWKKKNIVRIVRWTWNSHPKIMGGFAHHKDVKRYLYTPLDNVSPENLCKPESAETIEEYYKRANEVYKDLRFSEFKKWQKLKFLLEENELLRRANHLERK
ncbi:MAG: hypothetical protein J6H31_05180 [Butyrivibrio sp.]|nr:hypothetical protein [Butyrivibrio sp.]